jgi:flagellar assembly protein FliH
MPLTAPAQGPARFEAPPLRPVVRNDPRDEWEQARESGRREGFEAGYEAGMALAEADVNAALAEHHRATDRLASAARALEEGHRQLLAADRIELDSIEADVIELALRLAAEVIGRELRATDRPVRDALARAMRFVPERVTPVAVVHPDDAATAAEVLAADPRWRGGVEIIADPGIEPGGCVLEVGECRVDGQLGPALERMRDALTAD